MHWRRKWERTPAFLPGESQGRGSLVGCHLWGRTESDTTEAAAAAVKEINVILGANMHFPNREVYMQAFIILLFLSKRYI